MANNSTKKVKKSFVTELIETFIEEGFYPDLKHTEGKIKIITSSMKERLQESESKRHVFTKYNLVGRFVAKRIYEVDVISLNEYLYDLGLLNQVCEIDNKKIKTNELYMAIIEPFKLKDTFYIKPNFNKTGKELIRIEDFAVNDSWSLDDMASSMAVLKPQLKDLEYKYEQLKRAILKTEEMQKLMVRPKREPIPHKYGSLSLLANPPRYDISAIYDYIGEWMLIEYGTPNSERLEQFILNGTITKKEIDQFKTVRDIRLDFSVMSLEDERRILEMLDNKNMIAASNRLGA